MFQPCIIIPIYKHAKQFEKFAPKLPLLPLIIVDDGNSDSEKTQIEKLAEKYNANLVTFTKNQGKNAAIVAGFKKAIELGYTHAIQIDADGQHDPNDIARFLEKAKDNPKALINGCPVYDKTVPKSRFYGRKITNFWIDLETKKGAISDAMCGFRLYPLKEIEPIIQKKLIFEKMGGDIEIIVKAYWQGIDIINVDTKVIYPEDGFSNFQIFEDNIKISALHSMLFLIMLKNRFLRLLGIKK